MTPGGTIFTTAQNAIDIWTSFGKIPVKETANDLVYPSFVTGGM